MDFARALAEVPEPKPPLGGGKLKRKACRAARMDQMLTAAKSQVHAERMTLLWLIRACERCGRCKDMPPERPI